MASNNFCTNCGAPLLEGAHFCANCGTPVGGTPAETAMRPAAEVPQVEVPQTAMPEAEIPKTEVPEATQDMHQAQNADQAQRVAVANEETLPDQTQRLATPGEAMPMQPAGAQPYVPVRPRVTHPHAAATPAMWSSGERDRTTVAAIIVACVALVALALALLVLPAIMRASSETDQQTQQQSGADGGPGVNSVADKPQEDAEAKAGARAREEEARSQEERAKRESLAQQDSAFHDSLASYYGGLSGYDTRIRDAATDFNASFLSKDMGLRRSLAKSCSGLKVELQGKVDSLGKMTAPEGSSWTTQLALLRRCYQDHLNRITVIDSAWQIDLGYADPEEHQSEILGPISAGNLEGSSKSAALDDYEKAYPQIRL